MGAIRALICKILPSCREEGEADALRGELKEKISKERVAARHQRRAAKGAEKELRNSILNEPDRLIGEILTMVSAGDADSVGAHDDDDSR